MECYTDRRADVKLYFRLGDLTLASSTRRLACRIFDPTVAPENAIDVPVLPGTEGWLLEGLPVPREAVFPSFAASWLIYCKARYNRYFADLSGGYETYMEKFSAKTRSTFRRKLRKFSAASGGRINWSCHHQPEHMERFYRLARDISKKTYQERLLNAGLPEGDAFLCDLARRAQAGAVRGYILFLGEAPVSYLLLPIEGERAIYAFLGYDPEIAELSPGTVLLLLALEDLCRHGGVRYLDFTQGEGQHKELFGTFSIPCADLLLLRRSLRNRALTAAHAFWVGFEKTAGDVLDRAGVKKIVKSGLRKRFSIGAGAARPRSASGHS
jgi:CelD/BcsL family acetyltransferase involved in cellulose biosynthesis